MSFVHLHNHTHYSLLDGLTKIDELIERAKEQGSPAVAISDHGTMYGVIEFFQKCKKAGIKPIIGVEAYFTTGSRFDKKTKSDERNYHLLLLAQNNTGYQNLIKLTSIAHLEGFYYKSRVDWETLEKYHEGVIAASACLGGEIPQLILSDNLEKAEKRIMDYNNLFGQDNFYLELQHHPNLEGQDKVNKQLIEFSQKLNIPLIATNDIHYLKKEDDEAQDILLCLQNKKKKTDTNRMKMTGHDFSMRSNEEMIESFKHVPEAIENTLKIAEKCDVEIELGNIQLPFFEVPDGYDEFTYFDKICRDGLVERYGKGYDEVDANIRERMDYELSVIKNMGWPSYFLIVADFVQWAKDNGIVVGPGRGSAAGSLLCYLIGITNLDPLEYDLLFERFLNPERISMPDIDMDFADVRRADVINYVEEKYGKDHVAQIITFGTMAARAAVRDVGRVLDYPYDYCDKISKAIPMFTKIGEALETVDEFKEMYENEDGAKQIIDYAQRLEGVARHSSTHACGVLITKDPLTEYTPVQYASSADKSIVSQYSLHPVEDLGLLKMDFLGLKNLTIIESAIKIIKGTHDVKIDIDNIPLDDEAAYKLFQDAESTGVFQFECLSGDTIVSNTTIKKMYEKKNKDRISSVYLDSGKVHLNKVVKVVKSGKKKVYRLVAENGFYIKATADHYFLTDNGWKKLKDLKKGSKILIKTNAKHLLHNLCDNCGAKISGQKDGMSKYCYKCSASIYKNPSKKISRENMKKARQKFFEEGGEVWNKGLNTENSPLVKLTGKKISKALTGLTLEKKYGKERALEIKKEMSVRFKGENNPMFGKKAPHRKGGYREDLGHYVRSSWEADFARILNYHQVKYEYEPETFALNRENGEVINYTPDFFVKKTNTFYEIKGWMHDLDEEKISLFKKQYSQYNFVLISATKFAEFALKYRELIKWECPKIPEKNFEYIKVESIEYEGVEETYDIAMEAPGNNFIANGFVVHNSSGMKRYLRELKPSEFEDIVAMVALYRPGPMEWIPDYIAGKHGKKKVKYLHKKLEPILNKTYGVAIYQEQVMQIARDLAGFTMGEADVLRKAMGKKIVKLLEEQKQKFLEGCVKNGIEKKLAEKVFSFIEPFAGYGFNRSHAACYALIGYQTAYLKAHWPTEFMAALLTADQQNTDRIAIEIDECRNMGIEVMPPDINESFDSFTVVKAELDEKKEDDDKKIGTIRFGLNAIKNVGEHIVDVVIKERKANGHYSDIFDLIERVNDKDLNKKSMESLIKCGGFDQFNERGMLLGNLDLLLNFNKEINQERSSGQSSLFADTPELNQVNKVQLVNKPEANQQDKLSWEKELLGLYITEHPFNEYKKHVKDFITPLVNLPKHKNAEYTIFIAGVVGTIKKIITRKNETMLFVRLEDAISSVEILVFPRLLKQDPEVWQEGNVIICEGKVSNKDQDIKFLANKAFKLELKDIEKNIEELKKKFTKLKNIPQKAPDPLRLIFKEEMTTDKLNKLRELFVQNKGEAKVYFKITKDGQSNIIETDFRVKNNEDLVAKIKEGFDEIEVVGD